MSLYLLRKQARRCGLLLRAVPGGGWCLLSAATGAVIAGPLDLERIEGVLREKGNATLGAVTTQGKDGTKDAPTPLPSKPKGPVFQTARPLPFTPRTVPHGDFGKEDTV